MKYFCKDGSAKRAKRSKREATAIKHSIIKWEEVIQFIEEQGRIPNAFTGYNCALCQSFYCVECPFDCNEEGSAFGKFYRMFYYGPYADKTEAIELATAVLDALKALGGRQ